MGLLDRDYKKRIGTVSTDDIKKHPFFQVPDFETVCARRPTIRPEPPGEISVTQQEKEAGEAIFRGTKLPKKIRVSGTSASASAKDANRRRKRKGGKSNSFSISQKHNRAIHNRVASRNSGGDATPSGRYSGHSRMLRHSIADMSIKEESEEAEDDDAYSSDDPGQSRGDGEDASGMLGEAQEDTDNNDSPHSDGEQVVISQVHEDMSILNAVGAIAMKKSSPL